MMKRCSRTISAAGKNWPFLVSLAFFAVLACWAAAATVSLNGGRLIYSLDDAYIHMAVAKNLARHGIWGVSPDHFSSASSSPLWTLILAAFYRVVGLNEWLPLILNFLFGSLTLTAAYYYLKKHEASRLFCLATCLGIVLAAMMVSLTLMGMEHSLHLFLTIWFAGAAMGELTSFPEAAVKGNRHVLLPTLAAFLTSSRYEGLFLVGLVALALMGRRRIGRALAVGLAGALPPVLYGLISLAKGWHFFPNPVLIKAAGPSLSLLSAIFKPFGRQDIARLTASPSLIFPFLFGLALFFFRLAAERKFFRPSVLFPFFLFSMAMLHAHYIFSPTFWVYRYDAYLAGFAVFAAGVSTARDSRLRLPVLRKNNASAIFALAVVVAAVLIPAEFPGSFYPSAEVSKTRENYLEHVLAAKFVNRYYPDGPLVINDIGAMGFFTDAHLLDMFGLSDLEPLRFRKGGRAYTREDVRGPQSQGRHPSGELARNQAPDPGGVGQGRPGCHHRPQGDWVLCRCS